jgi:hypothetical protein
VEEGGGKIGIGSLGRGEGTGGRVSQVRKTDTHQHQLDADRDEDVW